MATPIAAYTHSVHIPGTRDRAAHTKIFHFHTNPIFLSDLLGGLPGQCPDSSYVFNDREANLIVDTHFKGLEAMELVAHTITVLPEITFGAEYMAIETTEHFTNLGKIRVKDVVFKGAASKNEEPCHYKLIGSLSVCYNEKHASKLWHEAIGLARQQYAKQITEGKKAEEESTG